MAQNYESNHRAFNTGATFSAPFLRAKCHASANSVTPAGATDVEIGVVTRAALTAGQPIDVLLCSANGTSKAVANGAITFGGTICAAASGKVAATGTITLGTCLQPSAADGDVVEFVRNIKSA